MTVVTKFVDIEDIVEVIRIRCVGMAGGRLFRTLSTLALVNSHYGFVYELTRYALGLVSDDTGYRSCLGIESFTDVEYQVLDSVAERISQLLLTDDVDGLTPAVYAHGSQLRLDFSRPVKPVRSVAEELYDELKRSEENGDYIPPRLRNYAGTL